MGRDPVLAPLLEIQYLKSPAPDAATFASCVFTSVYGVRGAVENLPAGERFSGKPVFAVGDATAAEAGNAGFTNITSASGGGEELGALINARLGKGKLLHICGKDYSGKFETLQQAGFEVARWLVYKATAGEALPAAGVEAIKSGKIESVLLFSPRSAAILVKVLAGLGLEGECAHIRALCLSPDVALAAKTLKWKSIEIAQRPDQENLLALLARKSL